MERKTAVIPCVISLLATLLLTGKTQAQLILNEANATGADQFVDVDTDKPYEGFDFGIAAYSGNDNSEIDPIQPGNPFPLDVNNNPNVTQTTLPNGWDRSQPTGWARIEGNGGDWMELVVTQDHTDLRGYTLYFENDEDFDFVTGENPDERGFIKFLHNKDFADLRAGTIITISEDDSVNEIRDQYSANPNFALFPPHDTGFDYDLSSDPSFDPFSGEDWHMHFHVDESRTDIGLPTEYFDAFSDAKVDNDEWTLYIFDATNTAAQAEAEDPQVGTVSDLTTGLVQGPIGESQPDWGQNTGAGGVNNQELLNLLADPADGTTSADFEDSDFSTFGRPNLYNVATEDTLDGAQDFSNLRDPVLSGTHDWTANGTADFGSSNNWVNARDGMIPAGGPAADWTARLANEAGGAQSRPSDFQHDSGLCECHGHQRHNDLGSPGGLDLGRQRRQPSRSDTRDGWGCSARGRPSRGGGSRSVCRRHRFRRRRDRCPSAEQRRNRTARCGAGSRRRLRSNR